MKSPTTVSCPVKSHLDRSRRIEMRLLPSRIAATLLGVLLLQPARAGEDEARRAYLEGWYLETAEKEPAKAAESYLKAVEAKGSDRTSAMALLRRSVCLRTLGKDVEAKALFEEVVAKYPAEADIATRARRYLAGKSEEAVASLPVADPRLEVLSLLSDMLQERPKDDSVRKEDLARFLGVLRLSSPEYVRDVVLAKNPQFGQQAVWALSRHGRSEPLPDADSLQLLTFSSIPELREAIYRYLGRKGDRSVAPRLLEQLDSTDPGLRVHAAETLGALEVQEAGPKILELFRREDDAARIRRYANVLGELRHVPAVEAISARLSRGEIDAASAVMALSRLGTPEAMEALKPLLLSEDFSAAHAAWNRISDKTVLAQAVALAIEVGKPIPVICALQEILNKTPYLAAMADVLPRLGAFLSTEIEKGEQSPVRRTVDDLVSRRILSEDWAGAGPSYSERVLPRWITRFLAELARRSDSEDATRAVAPLFRSILGTPLEAEAVEFFRMRWQRTPDFLDILRSGKAELRASALARASAGAPATVPGTVELWTQIGRERGLPTDVKLALIEVIRKDRDQRGITRRPAPSFLDTWSPAVLALLEDPDPDVVLACLELIRSLGAVADAEAFRGSVRRLLVGEGEKARPAAVRLAAIDTLAETLDPEGALVALRDPLLRIRLKAAESLSEYDKAYEEAVALGDELVQRYQLSHLRGRIDGILERLRMALRLGPENTAGDTERLQQIMAAAMDQLKHWVHLLGILCDSKREEIRRAALELLAAKREDIPAELGVPFALRAFNAGTAASRWVGIDLLGQYEQWGPLLSVWEELRLQRPALALSVACGLDRLDLIRSLREHSDPQIRAAAAQAVFERAKPEELSQFVNDPDPAVREKVAKRLAEAFDLNALATLVADPEPSVAKIAYKALESFSTEVKSVVGPGRRIKEFDVLDLRERQILSSAVARWLEKKGDAVWIGKAKELLDEAGQQMEEARGLPAEGRKEKNAKIPSKALAYSRYRELSRRATEILIAVLPKPEAVELLVSDPHVDPDLAAEALAAKGLLEPLKRLFAALMKEDRGERKVSRGFLKVLTAHELREELRAYADARASGSLGPAPDESVWSRELSWDGYPVALAGLVELGDAAQALAYLEKSVRAHGFERDYSQVIAASKARCPDGPMAFFDFVGKYPEVEGLALSLVEALKACRSAEGLKRCLEELPAPPAKSIFDALITIGEAEPVLTQAVDGEFWHEAAWALRDATDDWFGYFGPRWAVALPPEKNGFFSVWSRPVLRGPGPSPSGKLPPAQAMTVDPAWRRAAVEAWRAALKKGPPLQKMETEKNGPSAPQRPAELKVPDEPQAPTGPKDAGEAKGATKKAGAGEEGEATEKTDGAETNGGGEKGDGAESGDGAGETRDTEKPRDAE